MLVGWWTERLEEHWPGLPLVSACPLPDAQTQPSPTASQPTPDSAVTFSDRVSICSWGRG